MIKLGALFTVCILTEQLAHHRAKFAMLPYTVAQVRCFLSAAGNPLSKVVLGRDTPHVSSRFEVKYVCKVPRRMTAPTFRGR